MHGSEAAPAVFGAIFVLFIILFVLFITLLTVLVYCKIFAKTGYCWALGLLMFVPIANLIMLLVRAFGDWPVLRELRMLKQQQRL
jgi:hypothetical protein